MSLAEAAPLTSGEGNSSSNVSTPVGLNEASFGGQPQPASGNQKETTKEGGKRSKRALFGLGRKKHADAGTEKTPSISRDTSKLSTLSNTSNSRSEPAGMAPASPPRQTLDASPRVVSPAGSQIFERNVQDSTVLQPNSPAIPTHIQTENHIPPVLDHASEAITNEQLHPDSVEIVTHSSHLPAAVTVTASGSPDTPHEALFETLGAQLESLDSSEPALGDSASNYGSLDTADVRRLSFISFADVVQSEHTAPPAGPGGRESVYLAGMTSLSSANQNRSPSPIRSPVSSQGHGTSPPTSNPASLKGVELSPSRKAMGSPTSSGPQTLAAPGGELNIETMSQALRRTGSTDLSSFRSAPTSPIESPSSR